MLLSHSGGVGDVMRTSLNTTREQSRDDGGRVGVDAGKQTMDIIRKAYKIRSKRCSYIINIPAYKPMP